MREIKFRVWDTFSKELISRPPDYGTLGHIFDPNQLRWIYQQFTGLKDKNGVEIYEGDILRDKYEIKGKQQIDTGVIEFTNGCTCLKYHDGDGEYYPVYGGLSKYEVLGNIYENPELVSPNVHVISYE